MDYNMIEWYHDNGYMQDWAYYQQNGKSAQDNYIEQMNKQSNLLRQKKQEEDWFLSLLQMLDNSLSPMAYMAVEEAINALLPKQISITKYLF